MKKGLWIHLLVVATMSTLAYSGALYDVAGLEIPFLDKVLHFVVVGGIAFWWTAGWNDPKFSLSKWRLPTALVVMVVLATCEEALQTLSPYRDSNVFDWLANVLGVVTFWWLARRLLVSKTQASSTTAGRP